MGTRPGRTATHQYGYALEAIVEYIGTRLKTDAWSGVGWSAVEAAGLGDVIKRESPIKLPKYSDFPGIGYMERSEVVEVVARKASKPSPVKDRSLQELLDEYEGWLKQAVKAKPAGLDLVFLYY